MFIVVVFFFFNFLFYKIFSRITLYYSHSHTQYVQMFTHTLCMLLLPRVPHAYVAITACGRNNKHTNKRDMDRSRTQILRYHTLAALRVVTCFFVYNSYSLLVVYLLLLFLFFCCCFFVCGLSVSICLRTCVCFLLKVLYSKEKSNF